MLDRNASVLDQRRSANPWLWRPVPRPDASARLFCFAHAGGTAAAYRLWPTHLPENVEAVCLQLPAHGNRLQEPAIDSISELAEAIVDEISGLLDLPFAFFGHSMGALLAFEVARKMRARGLTLPEHLLLSGRKAPSLPLTDAPLHRLSNARFVEEIGLRYGGIPPEILEHPEVLELLLPALRADITALETYAYTPEAPLPVPVTAYGGTSDKHLTREGLEAWRDETAAALRTRMFDGGHFYLDAVLPVLIADINAVLAPMAARDDRRREVA